MTRDVRLVERDVPTIINPTDAAVGISETCVCGPTRGHRISR